MPQPGFFADSAATRLKLGAISLILARITQKRIPGDLSSQKLNPNDCIWGCSPGKPDQESLSGNATGVGVLACCACL